jgi:hypothetical protein
MVVIVKIRNCKERLIILSTLIIFTFKHKE